MYACVGEGVGELWGDEPPTLTCSMQAFLGWAEETSLRQTALSTSHWTSWWAGQGRGIGTCELAHPADSVCPSHQLAVPLPPAPWRVQPKDVCCHS